MTLLFFIFVLALGAGTAMYLAVRGHHATLARIEDIESNTSPVNLRSFARITDLGEQHFLRTSLPPRVYRRLQRERIRIATEYVKLAARNAAVLIRIGEMQSNNTSVDVQARAKALVEESVRLRLVCMLAIMMLSISLIFPEQNISIFDLVSKYERVADSFNLLSMLTDPLLASRARSWL